MVVEEIIKLERKVKELELRLLQERYQNIDLEIHHRRQSKLYKHFRGSSRYGSMITEQKSSSLHYEVISKGRKTSNRRASLGSALDFHSLFSTPRRSTGKHMRHHILVTHLVFIKHFLYLCFSLEIPS